MGEVPQISPLQATINAASPGAVIALRPGEYLGAMIIDKPLTIEGQGKKTWMGAKTSPVVLVKCAGVTLRNVMVEALGGGDALEALAGANPVIENMLWRGSAHGISGVTGDVLTSVGTSTIPPSTAGNSRLARRIHSLYEIAELAWEAEEWPKAAEYYRDILALGFGP